MNIHRRHLAALAVGALCGPVWSQGAYPTRAVKMINPFPPGSPVDLVGRLVAQKLQETWGQPVVIESRAGAGGAVGAEAVARAPADGYTLLVTSASTHVIAPALRKQMPYDAQKDFAPLALAAYGPTAVVVHPSVPVQSLAQLVTYAKANPGKVAYASSGLGTILHLSGELFAYRTGVDILHVPYKGAVPASTDLLSGQVQLMFDSISNAAPQVKAGKLRALAVLTPQRTPLMPDVPTGLEAGFDGLDFPAWIGFYAPAGTPREVVQQINRALQSVMAQAEIRERFLQGGLIPTMVMDADFGRLVGEQQKIVADLVRAARIPQQ